MSETTTLNSKQREEIVAALSKLRIASLLQIIATLIIAASSLSLLGAAFLLSTMEVPIARIGVFIGVFMAILVGLVMIIVAVYAFLLPSAKQLAKWKPAEFSTASKLLRIGYIWGAAILILALLLIIAGAISINLGTVIGGLAVAIIGGILFLLGYIGNIVYFFKLRDTFNSTTFLVAAILLIIGIFIHLLQFIAWILAFIEARNIEGRISSGLIQI
ncbi:MAG: DUF973 family protein [Ignisphaera sp.]|nr:DUF973 family protein [Ignisphaera sp.]MCX8167694.1 DUF973 family protein [Ignisphaera sp.]MDW8085684.1 DUF973 family protein [Ignisphaera sp.]